MLLSVFANVFYELDPSRDLVLLRAMPVMLTVLCILAIAYRYYSAFLAAKVAALDNSRITPAHTLEDGQNYHPTNRWVLFGHHFAAISGAGPLIGPVLSLQYGYAPGLLWLVIGVCLAGAVQDMLVLAASVRHGGKSLAEIIRVELGAFASVVASLAILVIVTVALAGLAIIVVKALGGEEAKLPASTKIFLPADSKPHVVKLEQVETKRKATIAFPPKCEIQYATGEPKGPQPESFQIQLVVPETAPTDLESWVPGENEGDRWFVAPGAKAARLVPGSSWGTFTLACTIPIALLVGVWMYRVRKGRVVEASMIGGLLVLGSVVGGDFIRGTNLEHWFSLSRDETVCALCIYGFIAAVLPVWLLLTPRDYLSSFMKIGTLGLLVIGVIVANPTLQVPPLNDVFRSGGPTFPGGLFPFVFICVMCGAISGFHALVSSGTTPKMIDKESDIRVIGYGAMLTEGLVGVVALIAAASLPTDIYFAINTDLDQVPRFQKNLGEVQDKYGRDPMHATGIKDLHELERDVGGESLRGRTGGAVSLAVGMSMIMTNGMQWADRQVADMMRYWYHFAIMFEALFILTTIDAGTRIARYLFQETAGKIYPPFARQSWLPGVLISTFLVTAGWGLLTYTGHVTTIWPMFGISNQLLAALALAVVTTRMVNTGRGRYAPLTLLPMLFVTSTTLTAGKIMVARQLENMKAGKDVTVNALNMGLTIFVVLSVVTLLLLAAAKWLATVRRNARSAA